MQCRADDSCEGGLTPASLLLQRASQADILAAAATLAMAIDYAHLLLGESAGKLTNCVVYVLVVGRSTRRGPSRAMYAQFAPANRYTGMWLLGSHRWPEGGSVRFMP